MPKVLIAAMIICSLTSGHGYCQTIGVMSQIQMINGEYIALEKMPSLTPHDAHVKWFHENTLLVRNGEAILDMAPVSVKGGKKTYSASDGGFFTYRGKFFQEDGQNFLELRLCQSDYVLRPSGRDPYADIKIRVVKFIDGKIDIDGVRYAQTALTEARRDQLLQLLNTEPVEKASPR